MIEYRNGDEVLFETPAIVVDTGPDGITVKFGDTMLIAPADNLSMVRRSVHVGDFVMHGDDKAIASQTLEEGVFLIRMMGKTGPEAYRAVHAEQLRHAPPPPPTPVVVPRAVAVEPHAARTATHDQTVVQEDRPVERLVHVTVEPASPTPDPGHAPAAEHDRQDVLELTDAAIIPREHAPHPASAPDGDDVVETGEEVLPAESDETTRTGVAGMADALAGMITRRRNLDHLGRTDVIKPLASTGDDDA